MTTRQVSGGWKPALCLFLLAPVTGELVTSSAPPFVFFVPWVFVLFAMLYGCGALLVRELAVRWGTGWWGVALLGAAYGILEEGLGAKSFFDPHWRALGMLGSHGRWMGVNWVWTIGLILFHSGFCIGASILAAGLPFPRLRRRPWLSKRWLAAVAIAYGFVLLLFFQKGNENNYHPPRSYYLVCLAAAGALTLAATRLGRKQVEVKGSSHVAPVRVGALGFLAIIGFVFVLYGLPALGGAGWLTAAALIGLGAVVAVLLNRWSDSGRRPFGSRQEYALVAGAYGAFALQAPLQEFNPARAGSAQGMTLVGAACALALVGLYRHLFQNELLSSERREPYL